MSAELRARVTAASALLADFQRARDEYAAGAVPSPDWLMWALRLASDLGIVLDQLGHEPAGGEAATAAGHVLAAQLVRAHLTEVCATRGNRSAAAGAVRRILADLGVAGSGPQLNVLTAAQAATAVAGLTDAACWHEYRASLNCADCAVHPADLCEEHAATLDAATAYRALAAVLAGARR